MRSVNADLRYAAALFVLAFVPFIYFYGGWGANQEVNFALARAIVEANTFQVDAFTPREGDISVGTGGHIYSNKAPGYSVLVAAPFAVQRFVHQRGWATYDDDYWPATRRFVTAATSGICGALIAPVLFVYARRKLAVSAPAAAFVGVAVAFATLVFPYSTMLFAHVTSALFLLVAFVLLRDRPLLAGVAAGIAGAAFFITGLAALVLVALAWSYSRRTAIRFVAGGAPAAVMLAIYQWVCFGSPFVTPVERSGGFTEQGLLLGVFGAAGFAANLWRLLFSEYRGLFFCSPVLLFAGWGAYGMVRTKRLRAELFAIGGVFVVFLLTNASFNGWHGGAAFGPRYLLPVIPLLAVPMMFVADRARLLWLAAVLVGASFNLAATAVDPMPLDGIERPLTGYILPKLLGGEVPASTWNRLCLENAAGVCSSGRVALWQGASNRGEMSFGEGDPATVLPMLLWIGIGSSLLVGSASRGRRRTARSVQPIGYVVAGHDTGALASNVRIELVAQHQRKLEQPVPPHGKIAITWLVGDDARASVADLESVAPTSVVVRGVELDIGTPILSLVPLPAPMGSQPDAR